VSGLSDEKKYMAEIGISFSCKNQSIPVYPMHYCNAMAKPKQTGKCSYDISM